MHSKKQSGEGMPAMRIVGFLLLSLPRGALASQVSCGPRSGTSWNSLLQIQNIRGVEKVAIDSDEPAAAMATAKATMPVEPSNSALIRSPQPFSMMMSGRRRRRKRRSGRRKDKKKRGGKKNKNRRRKPSPRPP